MTAPDQLVARALARAAEAVEAQPDSPEARARTVAALEAAIAQASTPPAPRQRWPLLAAAVAALVLGGGLWWGLRPPPIARVVASSGAQPVGRGFSDATLIESGTGSLSLELPRRVTVHLSPDTSLQLRDEGTRVLVRRGDVAAEVTALESPFVLEAGDTMVATRGARLRVKPGAGCDGRALVEVSEGAALVNGREPVNAGESWPHCAAPPSPEPRVQPLAPALEPAPVPQPAEPVKKAAPDDRLARQNQLYLQAVTLHQAGEVNAAVRKLDAILQDARSPLAEAALTHKMKWLADVDRVRARAAAREYLERFPMGFGRADAETLVLEKP